MLVALIEFVDITIVGEKVPTVGANDGTLVVTFAVSTRGRPTGAKLGGMSTALKRFIFRDSGNAALRLGRGVCEGW